MTPRLHWQCSVPMASGSFHAAASCSNAPILPLRTAGWRASPPSALGWQQRSMSNQSKPGSSTSSSTGTSGGAAMPKTSRTASSPAAAAAAGARAAQGRAAGEAPAATTTAAGAAAAAAGGSSGGGQQGTAAGPRRPPPELQLIPSFSKMSSDLKAVPLIPRVLGLAGALPFLVLSPPVAQALRIFLPMDVVANAAMFQAAYGGCIVSFLGAVHWGLAMGSTLSGPVAQQMANDR